MFIIISPIFDKVVHNSKILDAVEDIIGKNILAWWNNSYLLRIQIKKVL